MSASSYGHVRWWHLAQASSRTTETEACVRIEQSVANRVARSIKNQLGLHAPID